jgi:hypothetical protein
MANPSPYEIFPEPPAAPWTYNDSRFTYNESCFLYNGDWDLECLYGPVKGKKGGRSGKSKPKQYPNQEIINLLFNVHIIKEDEEIIDKSKRYQVPRFYKNINIAAEKIPEIKKEFFVAAGTLINKSIPLEDNFKIDITGSLEKLKTIKLPEPFTVKEIDKARVFHSRFLYETKDADVFSKVKKAVSRDVYIPKISGNVLERRTLVIGSFNKHEIKENSNVAGFLKGSVPIAPEEPEIFSEINKAVFRETEKISGIIEKTVSRDSIISVDSSLNKQIIHEEIKEIDANIVDQSIKEQKYIIEASDVIIEGKENIIHELQDDTIVKEIKVTSILEGNLSSRVSSSLVFNKMTKFPIKE